MTLLLRSRLPLRRVAPGDYRATARLRIVRAAGDTWLVLLDGEPLQLGAMREHGSLLEAHGYLADAVESVRERA